MKSRYSYANGFKRKKEKITQEQKLVPCKKCGEEFKPSFNSGGACNECTEWQNELDKDRAESEGTSWEGHYYDTY